MSFVGRLLRNADDELSASLADAVSIQPPIAPTDILGNNIARIDSALASGRSHEERLATELARITEELRQTRVSIEAFELAHGKMMEGRDG